MECSLCRPCSHSKDFAFFSLSGLWAEEGWHGMAWGGMRWDGMAWGGMGYGGTAWHGMAWGLLWRRGCGQKRQKLEAQSGGYLSHLGKR